MATEGTGFLVSKSLEKSNIYRLIQTKIFDEKKKEMVFKGIPKSY